MLEETRHATVAVEGEMCARVESDTWRLRCEQVRGCWTGKKKEGQRWMVVHASNEQQVCHVSSLFVGYSFTRHTPGLLVGV